MNQPKYITYRGAKYERVNTLNEIIVDPIPHRCCLIVESNSRGETEVDSCEFIDKPAKKAAEDFLQGWRGDLVAGGGPEELERYAEFLSDEPMEKDQFSYYGSLDEETGFIVCTRGRGAYSHIYDLAKTWNDLEKSYTADPGDHDNAYYALITALENCSY